MYTTGLLYCRVCGSAGCSRSIQIIQSFIACCQIVVNHKEHKVQAYLVTQACPEIMGGERSKSYTYGKQRILSHVLLQTDTA